MLTGRRRTRPPSSSHCWIPTRACDQGLWITSTTQSSTRGTCRPLRGRHPRQPTYRCARRCNAPHLSQAIARRTVELAELGRQRGHRRSRSDQPPVRVPTRGLSAVRPDPRDSPPALRRGLPLPQRPRSARTRSGHSRLYPASRRPTPVHSSGGSCPTLAGNSAQYVSIRYGKRLLEAGATASVGSVADSYDNAMAEALNGSFKAVLIEHHGPWPDADQVKRAVVQWVGWYNTERLHFALDYLPPEELEDQHHRSQATTNTACNRRPAARKLRAAHSRSSGKILRPCHEIEPAAPLQTYTASALDRRAEGRQLWGGAPWRSRAHCCPSSSSWLQV
ncbi:integrase core domain-containing protein [Streptomyces sp. NPDC005773]|uniref:integrase core domain-containing protein n=1 Tax=unclassified Streptomyces TaxID=2593676 RepID=UPI0036ABE981